MQKPAKPRSYLSLPITWVADTAGHGTNAPAAPQLIAEPPGPAPSAPAARYRLRGPRRPVELTVGSYYYDVRHCRAPMLRLRGLWLEQAGLLTGSRLSVRVEACKLVITVIAPPPLPPEKKPKRKPRWVIDRERMLSTLP